MVYSDAASTYHLATRRLFFLADVLTARDSNLTTAFERQRLGNTMPGQTAAIAANRLGILGN
jgi:hypothetical protein